MLVVLCPNKDYLAHTLVIASYFPNGRFGDGSESSVDAKVIAMYMNYVCSFVFSAGALLLHLWLANNSPFPYYKMILCRADTHRAHLLQCNLRKPNRCLYLKDILKK
jgi:hypothetical protein